MFDLSNKTALVTGASGDIGAAIARSLHAQGCFVALTGTRKTALEKVAEELGPKCKPISSDLSIPSNASHLIAQLNNDIGGIDILVQLNGNISSVVYWDQLKEQDWSNDIAINLGAPFFVAQRVFKHMKKKGGKIVFMSTASANHGGGSNTMAYGIAKAGLEALTKGMAREGGKYNILVNAIAPGLIKTRFHKEKARRTSFEIKKRANLSKLKRLGEPSEIAAVIDLLISEEVNYITGEVISVSGGDWI